MAFVLHGLCAAAPLRVRQRAVFRTQANAGAQTAVAAAPAPAPKLKLSRMTLKELRDECRRQGLSEEGVKYELQARLRTSRGGGVTDSDSDSEGDAPFGQAFGIAGRAQTELVTLRRDLQLAQRRIRVLEKLVVQKDQQLREARRVASSLLLGMPGGSAADEEGAVQAEQQANNQGAAAAGAVGGAR